MKILSSLHEIFSNARDAFKRFPISVLWAIFGTLYTIWFIDQKIDRNVEFSYIKVILTFVLGLSWLIATRLLVHDYQQRDAQNKNWLLGIPLVLSLIYYLTLPDDTDSFDNIILPYRFVLFFISGHLFILFSPFVYRWNKHAYWNYLKNIFRSISISVLFSMVLYLGLVLAMLALKYLFKFEIKEERYFELFILCVGVVNTWIFLAEAPINIHQQTKIDYPRALVFFIKYILIPLTVLYLVILYAYSIKILIKWNLPKGWVSYLIIALSVLGFIIHVLVNPVRKTIESGLIKKFYPWFYYALLPMILLLFVAISKRISDYGITENRYLVLIIALWITGMTLYILFSKRKKIRYFFTSLAILSLLVSFGFWGMFSVSIRSQAGRFDNLFREMKAKDFKVKYKEKDDFESIIQYLAKRKALDRLSASLGYNPDDVFDGVSYWQIAGKISDSLKIKLVDAAKIRRDSPYVYYNLKGDFPIDIKGYDYFEQIMLTDHKISGSEKNNHKTRSYDFSLDTVSGNMLLILKQDSLVHKIDLKPLLNLLAEQKEKYQVSQDVFFVEEEYDDCKMKILFQDMQVNLGKNKKLKRIIHASAYVLFKIKN